MLHSQSEARRVKKRGRDLVVACEKTRRQTDRPDHQRTDDPKKQDLRAWQPALQQVLR